MNLFILSFIKIPFFENLLWRVDHHYMHVSIVDICSIG